MMTQKELCGSVITRNMLSCIENGTANPSIRTLEYIAERLNIPAGILISEEEGSFTLKKSSTIDSIRKAYKNESYQICIDICNSLGEADDEIYMIMSHAYLGCARNAFNEGNLKLMCDFIDEAVSYNQITMYSDDSITAEASCYFRFASEIVPTLSIAAPLQSRSWEEDLSALGNDFCKYAYTLHLAKNGIHNDIFKVTYSNTSYAKHIEAISLLCTDRFGDALNILKDLIYGSDIFARPIMYNVLRSAEICAKNIENYKLAYEFSTSAISMLDDMLK
jgi:transcriptional regulator with XRE-family HTH domain